MNDTYVHPADPSRVHLCGQCSRKCSYCRKNMPAALLERINLSGALACKAVKACEMRQADRDPVTELAALLRAVGTELAALTTRELAELNYDLTGEPRSGVGGFLGSLRIQLACRDGSAKVIADVAADRQARKRRRAALKAAETRAARKDGTS